MIPQSTIPFIAAGGVVLVGINLVAATEYLQVLQVPEETVAAADATVAATPTTTPPPGNVAAKRLIGQPLAKQMTVRAAARRGTSDILAFACGRESATVATVAYQRPVAIGRKPLVAGVELWPTGFGVAAIDAIVKRAQACAARGEQVTVEKRKVAGYPAVVVTTVSGSDTIRTLRWSVGDITLSLTGVDVPVDDASIKRWSRLAATLLQPICADLTPSVKDARRSPWRDPDKYQGLYDQVTVGADLPEVLEELPPNQPRLRGLTQVQRPDPPDGVPYWPESLPAKVALPEQPVRPKEPATKRRVTFQVPDPTGPGCGWAFTASPTPEFSQAESDGQRDERVALTTQQLNDELSQWAAEESQWRSAIPGYYTAALAYRDYAKDVAAVSKAWDAIRADWSRYYALVAQRQQAIAQRAEWVAASTAWQNSGCGTATGAPAPGKAQQPGCAVPQILWKPLPQIPPEPSRPKDPRPPSAR